MALYYMVEPNYRHATGYKEIMSGLNEQTRGKRIPLIEMKLDEVSYKEFSDEDVALIIGASRAWLNHILAQIHPVFKNRIIVLSNLSPSQIDIPCNFVCSNLADSMKALFSYLRDNEKFTVAFFGKDPNSGTDEYCVECYLKNGGQKEDVYVNKGDLTQCFDQFLEHVDRYDAVICANSHAAIFLTAQIKAVRPEVLGRLFIISYENTLLLCSHSPSISSVVMNYQKFCYGVMTIYRELQKHSQFSSIRIDVRWELQIRETTHNIPYESREGLLIMPDIEETFVSFDPAVLEVQRVEELLQSFDENDWLLIRCVLAGKSYAEITAQLFMSSSSIKYRLKSMYKICNVSSRQEFVELLKKYL